MLTKMQVAKCYAFFKEKLPFHLCTAIFRDIVIGFVEASIGMLHIYIACSFYPEIEIKPQINKIIFLQYIKFSLIFKIKL